ncbi:hypothetical protein HOY82DRAFT_647197 [Tuber indicum]|nr:hypothetical protein HOY82DRAFT_647197 [Tuber indicum]
MGLGSRVKEVAQQADHRMLHALVTLVGNTIEGISFVLFMLEEAKKVTYASLFTRDSEAALAKELVREIVNRNIAALLNVDTIADTLRRRFGSFRSADDVVVFKAIEQVRRAKTDVDPDNRNRLPRESLRLFVETGARWTKENLRDTWIEYRSLNYYPGCGQLSLTVARESDRGNEALGFLADGGVPTVFHNTLHHWLDRRGLSDRHLGDDSLYVLGYLQRRSSESVDPYYLLWQYHARSENLYGADEDLHKLAQSDFDLSLMKRLEFPSRAKGLCVSYGPMGIRQKMNELSHTLQEELDVAVIQDDVLRRVKEDGRINSSKKERLIK